MGHGQHILEEASKKKKKTSAIGALTVRQFVPPLTLQTMQNIFYPTVLLLLQRCLGGLGSKLALQLHKLQNHAARIITFSSYDSTSGPLLQELGWDLLSIRRIKLLAIEMLKVYNNMAPEYLCQKFLKMRSTYDTRGSSSRFQLPLPKIIYGKKPFCYRGAFIWNKLTEDLLECKSMNLFKSSQALL